MIYWNRIYIKNDTIGKFRKTIYEIEKVILNRFPGNMNISLTTAKRIIPSWNSYMGMFMHTNNYNVMLNIIRNLNPVVKIKMQKVFSFDTLGFIRLRKHMKNVEFDSLVYDKERIRICLPENDLKPGNESIYYGTHIHKQTKSEEYEALKAMGLDYSCLKKNENDLPY